MHGGLILTNQELTGCQPIIHLIENANNIDLIANTGTGILFRLTVKNENTVYQNASGRQVNYFIIKIVIITDVLFEYELGNRIGKNAKRTETFTDFLNETRVQQQIWIDCIKQGLPEFTPSVANLSIFDNRQSSLFLNLLTRKFRKLYPSDKFHPPSGVKLIPEIIVKLTDNTLYYNRPPNIGVLLMPDMINTITLKECLISNQYNSEDAYVNTIVNVLILYLFHGIIHLDLHTENVLISKVDASSFIIDFGYIKKLESNNNSKKRKMSKQEEDLEIFNNMNNNTDDDKIKFVKDIINFIQHINITKHNENHENDSSKNHEEYSGIKWINQIDSKYKETIFKNAFDELKNIVRNRNENQNLNGIIFKLNDDNLNTYYCNENMSEVPKSEVPKSEVPKSEVPKRDVLKSDYNPYSNTNCKDNGKGCTISGGKIRTYVTKRKKKPKKTQKRNQKKHKKETKENTKKKTQKR